jgi:hypothetical protein
MSIYLENGDTAVIFKTNGRVHSHIPKPTAEEKENGTSPMPSILAISIMDRVMRDPDFVDEMVEYFYTLDLKQKIKNERHLKIVK